MNANLDSLISILNTSNSYLLNIAASIKVLTSDQWVKIGAIINIAVVLVAIYASNKEFFHNLFLKTKIKIDKDAFTLKQGTVLISRLTIRNIKNKVARNVTFCVEKLWYCQRGNWNPAANFLTFPLRWTHAQDDYKDLFVDRPYSLDLCQIIIPIDSSGKPCPPEIHLCTNYSSAFGPTTHGLDDLMSGKNKILLTLYCENHPTRQFPIEIEWDGNFSKPQIKVLKE